MAITQFFNPQIKRLYGNPAPTEPASKGKDTAQQPVQITHDQH
jgi:hypothetical protein